MMTNSVVDTRAATIHASFASRSTRPLVTLNCASAAHARVPMTLCATTKTTVVIPIQRWATSKRSNPYALSRKAGRAVRMIAPSDASAAMSPVS